MENAYPQQHAPFMSPLQGIRLPAARSKSAVLEGAGPVF